MVMVKEISSVTQMEKEKPMAINSVTHSVMVMPREIMTDSETEITMGLAMDSVKEISSDSETEITTDSHLD